MLGILAAFFLFHKFCPRIVRIKQIYADFFYLYLKICVHLFDPHNPWAKHFFIKIRNKALFV
ncbi:hypothetical protein EAH81_08770 [Flavobacterium pectinovorum]|uniref:Uncharacterized protein n=1 Tax=Flavobacterium pectinovorum TaxID=29533 RepID=A0A502EVI4_9FLAO|nr:hypothetical protein EAH81_08770 [Flavobacterium pectinovorum]